MQYPASLLRSLVAVALLAATLLAALQLSAHPAQAADYAAVAPLASNDGYWSVTPAGVVTPGGNASFYGDLRAQRLNAPIVGMATTPGDHGYWLVAADGGIFTFGNAGFFGSTGSLKLNKPIVGMAGTPSGAGYWLVASDGGIFSFGDANFFGSTGSIALNQPIVAMTPSKNGSGYWLVARDGGIFSSGSAGFFGSTGSMVLNKPIVGMAATASGDGYWLVAADGGVFTFGDAPFRGAALEGSAPVYGLAADGQGGYSILRTDGTVARKKGDAPTTVTVPVNVPAIPNTPSLPTTNTPITSAPTTSAPTTVPPTTTPPTTSTTVPTSNANPFVNRALWVDPSNPARSQAAAWSSSRPADAALMTRMGNTAAAAWIGNWTPDLTNSVRAIVTAGKNTNSIPVMVAYNIPFRDCGQWSSGGAARDADYEAWIDQFAAGLGSGPSAIILEPDALAQLDCLDTATKNSRLALLRYAVGKLSARPNTSVYLDAGHSGWIGAADMATRLTNAGIANARGFALNVSNYNTTADNTAYGLDLSARVGNKTFVIDTSRNGNGSNGEWCNPTGRALGATPTANTGNAKIDALLWLKRPGESDGNCNGGPNAGEWWADYALGLAQRAWS